MSDLLLRHPTMNIISESDVARQASAFAVDGLASQIIGQGVPELQAIAIERALELELSGNSEKANSLLRQAGFEDSFASEFRELVASELNKYKKAA